MQTAGDAVYSLEYYNAHSKSGIVKSNDVVDREAWKSVNSAIEEVLNKKASVLVGGMYVTGLILAVREEKEKQVGEAMMKFVHTFKGCSECIKDKIYIVNAETQKLLTYDLNACYMGETKLIEFNARDKLFRASLRLQTSLVINVDESDSEWEDKAFKKLQEHLLTRKYSVGKNGRIVGYRHQSRLDLEEAEFTRFYLLKTPWDTKEIGDGKTQKTLNLNIHLESVQTKDSSFAAILDNLMIDLDRTLIDRVFTNLDHSFVNLPKRVLVKKHNSIVPHPVCVLPGEILEHCVKVAGYHLSEVDLIKGEEPYGKQCAKLSVAGEPEIIATNTTSQGHHNEEGTKTTATKPQERQSQAERSIFEAGMREKVFCLVIAFVVISYIYFKFLM